MSLPSTAANKPVVLPKIGQVSIMQRCCKIAYNNLMTDLLKFMILTTCQMFFPNPIRMIGIKKLLSVRYLYIPIILCVVGG